VGIRGVQVFLDGGRGISEGRDIDWDEPDFEILYFVTVGYVAFFVWVEC
jgi:hypothetical protein